MNKISKTAKMPLLLGLGVGLIYLAVMPPAIFSIDGRAMVELAHSVVVNHNFRVSAETGALGPDGYYYSRWYPLLSVVAVPFVGVGVGLSQLLDLPARYVVGACALIVSPLLTAATTSLVALLALRLGSDRTGAFLAALSFAFGTIAFAYAGCFFAEPLLAFLSVLSLYLAFSGKNRDTIAASVTAGLSILAKPTGVILGTTLALYLLIQKRSRRLAFFPLLGMTLFVLGYGIYNYVRFNHLLFFGQSWMTDTLVQIFTSPDDYSQEAGSLRFIPRLPITVEGVLGLLISPGRGLLWYCPPVLLALVGFRRAIKSKRIEAVTIVAVFVGFLMVHSGIWWTGGWSWGPRYLLPALPGLLALTALVKKYSRYGLIALTVVGFLVNAPTAVSFYQRYYVELEEQQVSIHEQLWSFKYAPFTHGWESASGQIQDAFNSDVVETVKSAGEADQRGEMLQIVSTWWWLLPIINIPLWVGAFIALLMIVVGIRLISAAAV